MAFLFVFHQNIKSDLLKEIVKRKSFSLLFWNYILYAPDRSLKPTAAMNRTKCCSEIRYLTPFNRLSRLILIKCNQFISLQIPARLHFYYSDLWQSSLFLHLIWLASVAYSDFVGINYNVILRQAIAMIQQQKRLAGFQPAIVFGEV
jgi:hypothetical protein